MLLSEVYKSPPPVHTLIQGGDLLERLMTKYKQKKLTYTGDVETARRELYQTLRGGPPKIRGEYNTALTRIGSSGRQSFELGDGVYAFVAKDRL